MSRKGRTSPQTSKIRGSQAETDTLTRFSFPGNFGHDARPHLLVDLDRLLVLLQLCRVRRHLQQTLVGRAAINPSLN